MKTIKTKLNKNINELRPGIDKIRFSVYKINKKYKYIWVL